MAKLGIHCITYNHMPHKLPAVIHSLLGQTRAEDLDILVESDGGDPGADQITEFHGLYGCVRTPGFKQYTWGYIANQENTNDFGYSMHNRYLHLCNHEYIHFSSGDLYYVPTWAAEMLARADKGADFVYSDCLHNYAAGSPYQVLKTFPQLNYIDKSSFIVRTEMAKQIGLGTWRGADGEFVERFRAKFPNARMDKVEQVLWVHS